MPSKISLTVTLDCLILQLTQNTALFPLALIETNALSLCICSQQPSFKKK